MDRATLRCVRVKPWIGLALEYGTLRSPGSFLLFPSPDKGSREKAQRSGAFSKRGLCLE